MWKKYPKQHRLVLIFLSYPTHYICLHVSCSPWTQDGGFVYMFGIPLEAQNLAYYVGGLPSYHHISMENVWQNCHTTISLWPPTSSGAKISASLTGFRICTNTCTFLGRLGSHRPVCLKKATKLKVFCQVCFEILEYLKSIFFQAYGIFGT